MKYLIPFILISFFACKKESVTPPKSDAVQEIDSIKYVMSSQFGSRVTWRDEAGSPHTEQVQNLNNFTKKVKAISGIEYTLQADNAASAYVYIYLNDSLCSTAVSDMFHTTAFCQWTYH